MKRLVLLVLFITLYNSLFSQNSFQDSSTDIKLKREKANAQATELLTKLVDSQYRIDLILQEWDASSLYYAGDLISFNGAHYESLIDNNKSKPPSRTWKKVITESITIENYSLSTYPLNWKYLFENVKKKYSHLLDSSGRIKSSSNIHFVNCTIAFELVLSDLNIEGKLSFTNCNIKNLYIQNVQANNLEISNGTIDRVDIYNSNINYSLIRNLDFYSKDSPYQQAYIRFNNSKVNSISVETPLSNLFFDIIRCEIKGDDNKEIFDFRGISSGVSDLRLASSTFGVTPEQTTLNLHGNFSKIEIDSCIFNSNLNFSCIVQEKMHITNNKINGLLSINNSILPDDVKIRWDQLNGHTLSKFMENTHIVYDSTIELYVMRSEFITSTGAGISNINHYEDIMHSYQTLYLYYKNAGDIESANGCFSEMKDIQTERYAYLFTQERTFKSFFRWKLAQLMKFYTDHGTDPARAIVISMWVMLAFAVFYFFFPSDWDVTSKSKLFSNYKDFIEKNEKGYIKPFLLLSLGFIVSLLNAFTLSVNSFTTLGFGNIPTHGIAKYFCVLEGFIGWFLLSIFTVALINQVLG